MKAFAHLSPTVPAILVAAMGISLSVFLFSGARVQGEPTPLLAVIGGAAGRVTADLPAVLDKRASEPARKAAPRSELFVPQRRHVATKAHRRARSGAVQRAPATPVTTQRSFGTPTTATSKAHVRGPAWKSTAGAPLPRAHGRGKALGRTSGHHHGLPRGQAKKPPTAPLSAPGMPPNANGGGNGHKGGNK